MILSGNNFDQLVNMEAKSKKQRSEEELPAICCSTDTRSKLEEASWTKLVFEKDSARDG